MAFLLCFCLTGHGFKVLTKSYKLTYRNQDKVPILTLLSSNSQYLGLIYFKNLPKNKNVRKMSQAQQQTQHQQL